MSNLISIRRWEHFAHFNDAQIAQLESCAVRSQVAAGTTLLREGEETADAYLIEEGGIEIRRRTPYGMFPIAQLAPGDLLGETCFIDHLSRSGDAVASVDTELLTLDSEHLLREIDQDQRFGLALYWSFWKSLSKKLRLTNERLSQFFGTSGKPAAARPAPPAGSPTEIRVDLAAKRQLFQEQRLSNMEINFLSSLSRERKFAPGQILFREGDVGDEMYVVLEGRVMISKEIPGVGEEALAFVERGDYFGEMALIENQPRSADAKAHEEGGAVVLAISHEVLNGILDIHKLSSLRLLKILCTLIASRLRELDDKIIGWHILAGGGGGSHS